MSLAGDYTAGAGFRSRSGDFDTLLGSDPAAGAEISYTIPAKSGLLLQLIRFRLATSAVVANRVVCVTIDDDAGNSIADFCSGVDQSASETVDYTFAAGLGYVHSTLGVDRFLMGIPALYLPDGFTIKTVTIGKDVGDNYGAPIISGEVFK